jgi:hypothetical protein
LQLAKRSFIALALEYHPGANVTSVLAGHAGTVRGVRSGERVGYAGVAVAAVVYGTTVQGATFSHAPRAEIVPVAVSAPDVASRRSGALEYTEPFSLTVELPPVDDFCRSMPRSPHELVLYTVAESSG